ncbi:MAG TPA: VOC family protein [Pyrinomonadaceae bacterium]|nr:VOC family protein [Pyrinomonadaceae bacterium]
MKLNPYLNFNGQCAEAFEFYRRVLGGEIMSKMTWGEMPDAQIPPALQSRVMHVSLQIGDVWLMGADSPPDRYEKPQGISVALHYQKASEGDSIFNALAKDGNVIMPFQRTFWAAGFGMCVDRFDIPWLVNCERGA